MGTRKEEKDSGIPQAARSAFCSGSSSGRVAVDIS